VHQLFSQSLPDGRSICIAPVSDEAFEANQAHALGANAGYFIYEYDAKQPHAGIEILAKAVSFDAASRLADIYAQREV